MGDNTVFDQNGMPVQTPVQTSAQMPVQTTVQTAALPTSGLGVAGMVLGIIATVISAVPIINNLSFFLGIIGLLLGFVALGGIRKGKRKGKGIAIAAVVLGIVSVAVVIYTQNLYSSAIDSATEALESSVNSTATGTTSSTASSEAEDAEPGETGATDEFQNLAIGDGIIMESGLAVAVIDVQTGLVDYNGDPITCVTVYYSNEGDDTPSFNPIDWKAQDTSGVLSSETFYTEGQDQLGFGELAPGGNVTGNIYFEGDIVSVHYYGSVFSSDPTASWKL